MLYIFNIYETLINLISDLKLAKYEIKIVKIFFFVLFYRLAIQRLKDLVVLKVIENADYLK